MNDIFRDVPLCRGRAVGQPQALKGAAIVRRRRRPLWAPTAVRGLVPVLTGGGGRRLPIGSSGPTASSWPTSGRCGRRCRKGRARPGSSVGRPAPAGRTRLALHRAASNTTSALLASDAFSSRNGVDSGPISRRSDSSDVRRFRSGARPARRSQSAGSDATGHPLACAGRCGMFVACRIIYRIP